MSVEWLDGAEVPSDLAGDLTFEVSDAHADFFIRNQVVVLATQRLGPRVKYGAWVAAPREALEWPPTLHAVQMLVLDRLRPNPMPRFDLRPGWLRWARRRVGLR